MRSLTLRVRAVRSSLSLGERARPTEGRAAGEAAILAFFLFISPAASFADTSGAAFLRLGDGARPLALGGAYTAMPGDVDSLYHNPGAMPWLENPELSFSHSEWLSNSSLDLLSYAHPTALGTFGVSALRLGNGTLEGRDANRQQTGDFTAEDIACLLSYSHRVGAFIGVGANAKYLRSRIDQESASSIAVDAGATGHVPGQPLWFGVSVLNVGSGLRFEDQVDRLPLAIAIGSVYQIRRPFILAVDFFHEPYDAVSELRFGGEYAVYLFDFRVGYVQPLQGRHDADLSAGDRVRGGFGLHWSRYRADYTLAPFGDLGLTQRFTLSVAFGDIDARQPKNLQRLQGAGTDSPQRNAL